MKCSDSCVFNIFHVKISNDRRNARTHGSTKGLPVALSNAALAQSMFLIYLFKHLIPVPFADKICDRYCFSSKAMSFTLLKLYAIGSLLKNIPVFQQTKSIFNI